MENHLMIKNSIVLVPFPFDDFSVLKLRPALCLTSEIGEQNHIIIAFISSHIPTDIIASDYIMEKENYLTKGSGLLVDSVIRLHKLVTIPKSLIKRRLGILHPVIAKELNQKLADLFEIA